MGRIGSPLGKNEFSWVIKDFSSLGVRAIYSDEFVIGGCKWRLIAYPMGNRIKKYMSLYVEVADSKHLPSGWSINTELRMEVVNHNLYKPSQQKYRKNLWFDQKTPSWGYKTMIRHSKLSGEEGFLVSGEVTIVVKIDVYRVFGKVAAIEISEEGSKEGYEYESEEESKKDSENDCGEESEKDSEEGSRPLKKIKRNDDGVKSNDSVNKTQQVKETMDINGFQVLPSQVSGNFKLLRHCYHLTLVDFGTKGVTLLNTEKM
ncbi:TRAF-like family protein [Arabidopsis thaliana]|uniref:TRAF-like family protein n=1 Tax=Arabidopsis thaliana TaxID=3702 RepID=A0A1I9LMA7_ARATH|nr:TRAF-like family protein [Arabidopsis thaliana]ANM63715.1 TRAF-like family protein [Arabidopsis thaliana]|eukprot:NP_001325787.1 TRAF-like family protein [Arabidopsis thaliana]